MYLGQTINILGGKGGSGWLSIALCMGSEYYLRLMFTGENSQMGEHIFQKFVPGSYLLGNLLRYHVKIYHVVLKKLKN